MDTWLSNAIAFVVLLVAIVVACFLYVVIALRLSEREVYGSQPLHPNMSKTTMNELQPFYLQQSMKARQGAECVYWEKAVIVHARLDEVRLNLWGVNLKFRDLSTPGFTGDARPQPEDPSWTANAAWIVLTYSEESWSALHAGWSVYFDPRLIESLRKAAQRVAGADWDSRYRALVDCYYARASSK